MNKNEAHFRKCYSSAISIFQSSFDLLCEVENKGLIKGYQEEMGKPQDEKDVKKRKPISLQTVGRHKKLLITGSGITIDGACRIGFACIKVLNKKGLK